MRSDIINKLFNPLYSYQLPRKSSLPWIIVTTQTPWEEIPRIRHQVARALTRYYQVLYVSFPTDWRRKTVSRIFSPQPRLIVWESSNMWNLPKRLSLYLPWISRFENFVNYRYLQQWISNMSIDPVILINFSHNHYLLENHSWFYRIVYFCNDDFEAIEQSPSFAVLAQQRMHEAAKRADLCLTVSQSLADKLQVGKKAQVFLPGHDLPIEAVISPLPYKIGDRIRVGYMGNLDWRISYNWLEHVISEADLELHIAGPIDNSKMMEWIKRQQKVHYHGKLLGNRMHRWLRDMDVLTIPYEINEGYAKAMAAPNKTFAYLSAGKPIVLPNWPNLIDWGDGLLYRAEDADDFILQIRRARVEDSSALQAQRLAIAGDYTLARRAEDLHNLLETLIDNRMYFNEH